MLFLLILLIRSSQKNEDFGRTNVLVMGKESSCKELLINELFREDLVNMDLEKNSKQEIQKIQKKGFPLSIYNAPGLNFETNQYKKVKKNVINFMKKQEKSKDPTKITHCILYSIKKSGNPLDENEIKFLRDFSIDPNINNTPIIVVIIENDRKGNTKKMIAKLKQLNLKIFEIVHVIVKKKMFLLPFKYHYGLKNLYYTILNSTSNVLVENKYEFHNETLKYKRLRAYGFISMGTLAASGFGYKRLTISKLKIFDSIALLMFIGIQKSYGVHPPANFINQYIDISIGNKVTEITIFAEKIIRYVKN